jgi:hypothetical protein
MAINLIKTCVNVEPTMDQMGGTYPILLYEINEYVHPMIVPYEFIHLLNHSLDYFKCLDMEAQIDFDLLEKDLLSLNPGVSMFTTGPSRIEAHTRDTSEFTFKQISSYFNKLATGSNAEKLLTLKSAFGMYTPFYHNLKINSGFDSYRRYANKCHLKDLITFD